MYDVSEEKVNDIAYFNKLGKIVDDKEFQLLFYKDMIQRYEKIKNTFNANDKPMTQTRKIKIIEGLSKLYKYLKDYYILLKEDLNEDTRTFYENYRTMTKDMTSINNLGRVN